jgi:hypothetical protein
MLTSWAALCSVGATGSADADKRCRMAPPHTSGRDDRLPARLPCNRGEVSPAPLVSTRHRVDGHERPHDGWRRAQRNFSTDRRPSCVLLGMDASAGRLSPPSAVGRRRRPRHTHP